MTDSTTESFRYRFDADVSPSVAVVEAICQKDDNDPKSLPTLHDTLDPDALDSILESTSDGEMPIVVSFAYAGYSVTVGSHGVVTVDPI